MTSQTNHIWYVYGVVAANATLSSPPDGMDDITVFPEQEGGIAALVSPLDANRYRAGAVEASSGDVEWLSPRAVAHDRVLTWASDRAAVVPFPMFSLFSSRDAVRRMLSERSSELGAALQRVSRGREYALRVYRVDAELLESVAALSPRLREMASSAATASPGQRYLIDRKLDAERKTEMRAVSQQIVEEIVTSLSARSLGTVRSPIPRISDAGSTRGTMLLNAAFLVAPASLDEFQRTLTGLVDEHQAHGFRFDFTGPWPAYHFATDDGRGTDGR